MWLGISEQVLILVFTVAFAFVFLQVVNPFTKYPFRNQRGHLLLVSIGVAGFFEVILCFFFFSSIFSLPSLALSTPTPYPFLLAY